MFKIEYKLFQR